MDTSKLKPFAQDARRILKAQVSARLDQVLADQSAARREQPKAVSELEAEIAKGDRDQVIDKVAYTWFNRFTALRFMDANGYTRIKVVSPAEGQTRPEILAEAAAGNIDEDAPADVRNKVAALLDGRTPSRDPQGEAYCLLLVAACNHWHSAMPFLFEKIADYTELLMPEDLLSSDSILAKAKAVMTEEACQDVEVIGWLYQFYISEKKDEVFAGLKKNKKITAENIPAATQLFTPHWIVRYLVENSLGRLWLLNRPNSKLAAQMDYYIAPEELETDFLRISRPEDIRICDPACGSGHMLTYAFDLLYAIYEEEGYDTSDIPSLILSHNLHGIEIDDRAGALAAFALIMKAAAHRKRFLRAPVQPNICVMQSVCFTAAEMRDVATVVGRDLFTDDLRETLLQFEHAKNFGSLIVPKLCDPAEALRAVEARDFGSDLLLREVQIRVVTALRMAEALSPKYHIVVANPPYMGRKGMNGRLQEFIENNFPLSKDDFMVAFMDRSALIVQKSGYWGMINIPSWMFAPSYTKFRSTRLRQWQFSSLLHIGRGVFGADFGSCAFIIKNALPDGLGNGVARRLFDKHVAVESESVKLARFFDKKRPTFRIFQDQLLALDTSPIAYWIPRKFLDRYETSEKFGSRGSAAQGIKTGDNDKFLRLWHEVSKNKIIREKNGPGRWAFCAKGGEYRKWYGNRNFVIDWEDEGRRIKNFKDKNGKLRSRPQNIDKFFKCGGTWSAVSSGSFSMRFLANDMCFESAGSTFVPNDPQDLVDAIAFANSKVSAYLLDFLTPGIGFREGAISALPFIKNGSHDYAKRLIEITKMDWAESETSDNFETSPLLFVKSELLEDNFNALKSRWHKITDEAKNLEEEINHRQIESFGLQNELSPELSMSEVTLNCNPAYRYGEQISEEERQNRFLSNTISEFLSYAVGCMFGRYSLDAPGLILAHQGESLESYLAQVPRPQFLPDADNVIPVLEDDWFADDITERFRKFLRATFGEARFAENLAFIEDALGKDVRRYFARDFFNDHVKRYRNRPIYWLFSSPKGSFQALIYMHRYRPDTVSVVLNDYLREYRNKLEAHRKSLEATSLSGDASSTQRAKAEKEISEVAKTIAELDAYERDVLFPLATQKIEVDLDDGVKANYPKFGDALKPIKGLTDADD